MITPKNYVLVVGSVHVDTIADVATDHKDAAGIITRSIGGTAFNIASNLASNSIGRKVFLFSFLSQGSLLSPVVKKKISAKGIRTKFISRWPEDRKELLTEGGYIGIRRHGHIVKAATHSPIGESDVFADPKNLKRLERAIRNCSLLIIDTNVHEYSLEKTISAANKFKKPFVICLSSDNKALVYRKLQKNCSDNCIALSAGEDELREVLSEQVDDVVLNQFMSDLISGHIGKSISATEICDACHSNNVVCTIKAGDTGPGGYYIFSKPDTSTRIPPPDRVLNNSQKGSLTGLTDAVISGAAGAIANPQNHSRCKSLIDPVQSLLDDDISQQVFERINDHVRLAVEARGATPGSETELDKEAVDDARPRLLQYWDLVWREFMSSWTKYLVGAVLLLVFQNIGWLTSWLSAPIICLFAEVCRTTVISNGTGILTDLWSFW